MLGGEAMGVGGMSAMLKESMESMESEGVVVESSAAESGAGGAPAPGPGTEPVSYRHRRGPTERIG